jgi:segregation and condensation protein A
MNYEVQLDLFRGPLDLLLYLVKKEEIRIRDIEISKITDQYLQYLEIMKTLNLDIAGEFIVMAAILLRIKAQELLPVSEREKLAEGDDFIDREKLIAQMEEYARFKRVAESLREREDENLGTFYRSQPEKVPFTADDFLEQKEVQIYDLIMVFKRVLETARKEPVYFLEADNVTIDDRIDHVLSLVQEHKQLLFADLFEDDCRRIVLVVTFMAVLELIKMDYIGLRQEEFLGDIVVYEKAEEMAAPVPDTAAAEPPFNG